MGYESCKAKEYEFIKTLFSSANLEFIFIAFMLLFVVSQIYFPFIFLTLKLIRDQKGD